MTKDEKSEFSGTGKSFSPVGDSLNEVHALVNDYFNSAIDRLIMGRTYNYCPPSAEEEAKAAQEGNRRQAIYRAWWNAQQFREYVGLPEPREQYDAVNN